MKNTLVIGRCWKFLDFLIPSVDSVINYNNADLIIIDSMSSRSDNIASYCRRLLKNKEIKGFITSDNNYLGNIWHVNKYLVDIFDKYEYICLTDLDLRVINPKNNWLVNMTDILGRNAAIGAVSGDFDPMPPISDHFVFSKDHPELKMEGENFWNMLTDGWFYTTRSSEFLAYINSGGRGGQFGPGMHGYNSYCYEIGKMIGRTDIVLYHYGWLRYAEEWNATYKETGISFNMETSTNNNHAFMSLQGNWDGNTKIPNKHSFSIELL